MWPLGDFLVTAWGPLGDHLETTTRPLRDHYFCHWKYPRCYIHVSLSDGVFLSFNVDQWSRTALTLRAKIADSKPGYYATMQMRKYQCSQSIVLILKPMHCNEYQYIWQKQLEQLSHFHSDLKCSFCRCLSITSLMASQKKPTANYIFTSIKTGGLVNFNALLVKMDQLRTVATPLVNPLYRLLNRSHGFFTYMHFLSAWWWWSWSSWSSSSSSSSSSCW